MVGSMAFVCESAVPKGEPEQPKAGRSLAAAGSRRGENGDHRKTARVPRTLICISLLILLEVVCDGG